MGGFTIMVLAAAKYRYNPDDFQNMFGLSEDLEGFYNSLERYKKQSSFENRIHFMNAWEDVFFSIKHREVEGILNPVFASELRDYLEDIANDKL
jgi:hypothetical protein